MSARAALALAFVLALAAPAARATEAPADTALGRFLGGLADSTDRYFGASAAPLDTVGLDSALVSGLAHPPRPKRRLGITLTPDVRFDRVDGTSWGGGAGLGSAAGFGRLDGGARWASGSKTWLGGAGVTLERPLRGRPVRLTASVRRFTDAMDRDASGYALGTLRAFLFGSDTRRLLRRDGPEASLAHERPGWRAEIGYRDQLERPLAVTTTWDLTHTPLAVTDNLPAWRGRARELRLTGRLRLPGTPLDLDVTHWTSGRRLGSDFEYRRTSVGLGGDVGLGRWLALVPEATYGRLTGQAVPQAAFYLGGSSTLRSFSTADRGGTGLALARLGLMTTFDVLEATGVPHPAAFPVELGVFAGTGAVWGPDPYTGRVRPGVDWPDRSLWLPELGVSLLYQPGLPSPSDLVRVDYAWGIGHDRGGPRISVSYTHALELVRPPGR